MRKYILVALISILFFSCSNDEKIVLEDLSVEIRINKPAVYLLEPTDFIFTFNRPIKNYIVLESSDVQNYLSQSIYSPLRSWTSQSFTTTPPPANLIFHFKETKDLSIIAKDALDQLFIFNFQVDVLRGEAVKIKKVKVSNINSLNQINNCAFTNVPSHAGFRFSLHFPQSVLLNQQIRYHSSLKPTNDELTWDVEHLYIKSNLDFTFHFEHSLCNFAYPNKNFNLNLINLQSSTPQFVNYTFNNYNLNVELELEWP